MVPLSDRLPAGVTCSVTAPVRSWAVITAHHWCGDGDVDLLGDQAAIAVVEVMVKLSTLVWSLARYSTAESATV